MTYLGLVEAGLLGHFLAVLLRLIIVGAILGLLGLADGHIVGVAPLGVLDISNLGLGLLLNLLIDVHTDLNLLSLDLLSKGTK